MKKSVRIILWICFVFCAICTVFSLFGGSDVQGSLSDKVFERISNALLFGIIGFGFVVELNLFGLKEKLPLIKNKQRSTHILFWVLLVTVAFVLSFSADRLTAKSFRDEKHALIQASEEEKEQQKKQKKEQESISRQIEKEQESISKQLEKEQESLSKEKERLEKEASEAEKQAQQSVEASLQESLAQQTESAAEPVTEEPTAAQSVPLTWNELLKTPDRYREVISLIGENYNAGGINDALAQNLSEDELALAREVFESGNKVPDALNDSFATFCEENGYDFPDIAQEDFYKRVSKGLRIGRTFFKDRFYLSCYELPLKDYTEDKRYLDAERYVDVGCILYTNENGKYKEYAEVLDVRYGVYVDNACFGFAIKLKYLDPEMIDPDYDETEYFMDGDNLFNLPRKLNNAPGYFVAVTDLHRAPEPNRIDYYKFWKWKPLYEYYGALDGVNVYFGTGSCKAYQFTVVSASSKQNTMTVQYPDGNVEVKNYWTMHNNKALYIIED